MHAICRRVVDSENRHKRTLIFFYIRTWSNFGGLSNAGVAGSTPLPKSCFFFFPSSSFCPSPNLIPGSPSPAFGANVEEEEEEVIFWPKIGGACWRQQQKTATSSGRTSIILFSLFSLPPHTLLPIFLLLLLLFRMGQKFGRMTDWSPPPPQWTLLYLLFCAP